MRPFKLLIVDDSTAYRRCVREIVSSAFPCEILEACDGAEGLEKALAWQPDVITLDFEMPVLDGLGVLRGLKAKVCKAKVLLLSRYSKEGADITIQGLALGAYDFICKPHAESMEQALAFLKTQLTCQIASLLAEKVRQPALPPVASPLLPAKQVLAIGASTGGPSALMEVLPKLPAEFAAPILLVQHMPALFTEAFAEALNKACALDVRQASDTEPVRAGCIYVAPGGRQMRVSAQRCIEVRDDAKEHFLSPSVDYLFRSVAQVYENQSLGIVMSGMGTDGTEGLKAMRAKGAVTIAQAEAGCAVFGMPRAAILAGCAQHVVPLGELATTIASWR